MSSSISSNVKQWLSGLFPSATYIQTDVTSDADNYEDRHKWFSKINKEVLSEMMEEKNSDVLLEAEGVETLILALGSDTIHGIPGDSEDLRIRRELFGSNTLLETPVAAKGFIQFVIEASKDVSVLLLLCSMMLALGSGIKTEGWKDGWHDGVQVFLSMIALVAFTAVCNFRQAKLFNKQSNESTDTQVSVIRSGQWKKVSVHDIVVGDVVKLNVGGQIPADGLLVPLEYSIETTDSSIMVEEDDKIHFIDKWNPFLSFGMKVKEAYGRSNSYQPDMLVTAVGERTIVGIKCHGIEQSKTHFQAQFAKLSSYKEKVCMVIALLLLVVSFVDCILGNAGEGQDSTEMNVKKATFNEMMTAGMTFVKEHKVGMRVSTSTAATFLLAIPEGFSLVVTLLVISSRRRLMKDVRAKVQKLFPCVTAGSVSAIVTDQTSFLIPNRMAVIRFSLGEDVNDALTLPPRIRAIMYQGIGLNTSSILLPSPDETAILSWAETHLHMDMEEVRRRSTILYVETLNPMRKGVGVWIRNTGADGKATDVHWKGSAMILGLECQCHEKATEAADDCRRAGINVVMVSNANISAANALAARCGILGGYTNRRVIEAEAFWKFSEQERLEMVDKICGMANSSSDDKLRLVQYLKQKGHVVAVTGTGMSDAPVLEEADVSLSMGSIQIVNDVQISSSWTTICHLSQLS